MAVSHTVTVQLWYLLPLKTSQHKRAKPRLGGHTPTWNRDKATVTAEGVHGAHLPLTSSQGRSSGAGLRKDPLLFS